MLDPRIYRAGLIVAALALVVLAFSLRNQSGALSPTLAPDAFNAGNVASEMQAIAAQQPSRAPGSAGDRQLAATVQGRLNQYGFATTVDSFAAATVKGTRLLENVIGTRPGMQSGSIVIVAPRDAAGAPALAAASGTATLLELARDLSGETLQRTIVLASTSGSAGAAGAVRLASTLPGPIDAVVVLGDLASGRIAQPIVIPWANGPLVAPPALRNTLAAALSAQASIGAGATGLGGQFARLAFPLTLGLQAPLVGAGIPAVELSLSGERGPAGDAPVGSMSQLANVGRGVLTTISALDGGPDVGAPSAYLLLDGKVVPRWAIALFGLALLVPVLLTTIDGVARARRRGHVIWRSLAVVIAAAAPFLAAILVVLAAGLLGVISITPPGPVPAGAVPVTSGAVVALAVAGMAMLICGAGAYALIRKLPGRRRPARGRQPEHTADGAVAALLVVLCAVFFLIWLRNPFAALLLVPAVHLWTWAISPDASLPLAGRLAAVLVGVAPVVLVVLYYCATLGYGPGQALWQAALLVAGRAVALPALVLWSLVLGCLLSVATLAVRAARDSRVQPTPVTVRGPVTYAGPGSLGGTKSALRR